MPKLTLSIKEETVKRARKISKMKGKSISKMVEEYFDSLAGRKEEKENAVEKTKKLLKGKVRKQPLNWKTVKEDRLSEKYGL